MATIRDDVLVGTSASTGGDGVEVSEDLFEAGGGLAPFLAQPGLRPGVVVAAVLLVLPFLALAVQALRVSPPPSEGVNRRVDLAACRCAAAATDLGRV